MTDPTQLFVEVDSLVHTLFGSTTSQAQLVSSQERLVALQNSHQGWMIGEYLLRSSDTNSRLFGAVTLSNKLNRLSATLNPEEAQSIHNTIVTYLVQYTLSADDARLSKKLASTLALFYIVHLDGLANAVSYLVFALLGHNPSTVNHTHNIRTLPLQDLQRLSKLSIVVLLLFISGLGEEGMKRNSSLPPSEYKKLNESYAKTITDIIYLIEYILNALDGALSPDEVTECRSSAMSTLSVTRYFYLNVCMPDEAVTASVKRCLTYAIAWVNNSRSPDAIKELNEFLSNDRILDDSHFFEIETILTTWGQEKLREEISDFNPDDEAQILALLLAYTDTRLASLLEEAASPEDSTKTRAHNARMLLEMMQELVQTPGYPEVEDFISPRALEFWNQLIEYVEELMIEEPEGETEHVIAFGKNQILRVVQQLRIKVKSPTSEEWNNDLDTDQQRGFRYYRSECIDTIQSSYRVLGGHLIRIYAEIALNFASQQDWRETETAIFCLMAIGSTEEANDNTVKVLFESLLPALLSAPDVDLRALRTTTDLIGVSTPFLRRNPQLLNIALEFLFYCLQDNQKPNDASRAIMHVCDTCRVHLIQYLPLFFQQYDAFINKPTATQFAIEKISGAIGYLLQTLPNLSDTIAGVTRLLDYVTRGIEKAAHLSASGNLQEGHELARMSLNCLSSVATSLRAPTDIPLEIDANAIPLSETTLTELKEFQSKVFKVIATALTTQQGDHEIIEELCNVFKSGFTESPSFPFHFTPDIVYQFFAITTIQSTNLEDILRMIMIFLKSQERVPGPPNEAINGIIHHISALFQSLKTSNYDSDVMHILIEVLERTIPHWIGLVLQLQPSEKVEDIFNITIATLQLNQPLPRRSALNFWNTLISLKGGPDYRYKIPIDQPLLDQVIVHYGQSLGRTFGMQLTGGAVRSDLDYLSAVVRNFLRRDVRSKDWLQQGIDMHAPVGKVDENSKRIFIQKLSVAKDLRTVREAITQFWGACSGFSPSYKPL